MTSSEYASLYGVYFPGPWVKRADAQIPYTTSYNEYSDGHALSVESLDGEGEKWPTMRIMPKLLKL